MIPLESPVPEIGPPGSESGGRKRTHGTRPAARLRKRRISHRPLPATRLSSTLLNLGARGFPPPVAAKPRPRAAGIVGQLPRVRGRTPGLPRGGDEQRSLPRRARLPRWHTAVGLISGDLLTSRSGGQKGTPPAQMRGPIRRAAGGGGAAGYVAAFFLRAAQEAFIRADTASFSLAVIGRRFLAGVASDAVSAAGVAAAAGRREEERRAVGPGPDPRASAPAGS